MFPLKLRHLAFSAYGWLSQDHRRLLFRLGLFWLDFSTAPSTYPAWRAWWPWGRWTRCGPDGAQKFFRRPLGAVEPRQEGPLAQLPAPESLGLKQLQWRHFSHLLEPLILVPLVVTIYSFKARFFGNFDFPERKVLGRQKGMSLEGHRFESRCQQTIFFSREISTQVSCCGISVLNK